MTHVVYDVTPEEAREMSKAALHEFAYTYVKPRIVKVNDREVVVELKRKPSKKEK